MNSNLLVRKLFIFSLWFVCLPAFSQSTATYERCLLDALSTASADKRVADVRAQCAAQLPAPTTTLTPPPINIDSQPGILKRRIDEERRLNNRSFALTAHRPTYFLPFSYNSHPNSATFPGSDAEDSIDEIEAQFQVSFKFPIVQRVLGNEDSDLFLALTTRSWWQAYNLEASSPFRDTDYEPEIFYRHYGGPSWGSVRMGGWDVGFAHQSNGQTGSLSRSWNRINAGIAFERGNVALGMRAWYRIPEDKEDEQNPDLSRFMGYGDMRLIYSHKRHVFSAMLRHGSDKGAIELTWSRPLWHRLRLFALYFEGYGENLLDYNHYSRRIGIGIGLNDYVRGESGL